MNDLLHRTGVIEATRGKDSDVIRLSFSSESPVPVGEFVEILDHGPGSVDLTRLNTEAPLLENHDSTKRLGKVLRAWVENRRGYAEVKFSGTAYAQEILRDVKAGVFTAVSVGYRRLKELGSEMVDGALHVRYSFAPHEISLVSIPADISVGVGRASDTKLHTHRIEMTQNSIQTNEEINSIARLLAGKVNNVDELATRAICEGWSVEQFRESVLRNTPNIRPLDKPILSDVKPREWANYSLSRALVQCVDGNVTGFEREMSQEIARRIGKSATGFWVPPEALRGYVAGGASLGAEIVETSVYGSGFIDALRHRSTALEMGATRLTLNNPVTIPRRATSGAVNWVGETVAATLSTGSFESITLTPKAVSAWQNYSKQLLVTGNPSIDALVRQDIIAQIAAAVDNAVLNVGGGSAPTGIAGTAGINTLAIGANGDALTTATAWPALISLETMVSSDLADVGSLGYVMDSTTRGKLKTVTKTGLDSQFCMVDNDKLAGYKVGISNQLATNGTLGTATTICSSVMFGNWADLIVAEFNGGAVDIVSDNYTLAHNGVIRVIARYWVDAGLRHNESFAQLLGVLNG